MKQTPASRIRLTGPTITVRMITVLALGIGLAAPGAVGAQEPLDRSYFVGRWKVSCSPSLKNGRPSEVFMIAEGLDPEKVRFVFPEGYDSENKWRLTTEGFFDAEKGRVYGMLDSGYYFVIRPGGPGEPCPLGEPPSPRSDRRTITIDVEPIPGIAPSSRSLETQGEVGAEEDG